MEERPTLEKRMGEGRIGVRTAVNVCPQCHILFEWYGKICHNMNSSGCQGTELVKKDLKATQDVYRCEKCLLFSIYKTRSCCVSPQPSLGHIRDLPASMYRAVAFREDVETNTSHFDKCGKDQDLYGVLSSCVEENEKALEKLTALFGEDPIDNAVESFSRLEKQIEHLSAIVPGTCKGLVKMKDLLEKMQPLVKKATIHKNIIQLVGQENVIWKLSTYLESCDIVESWEVPEPVDDMKMLENMLEKEM
jgi:hypothetical protein